MHIAINYIECGILRYALIVTGEVPIRVLKVAVEVMKVGVYFQTTPNIIGALPVGGVGGAVMIGSSKKIKIQVLNFLTLFRSFLR